MKETLCPQCGLVLKDKTLNQINLAVMFKNRVLKEEVKTLLKEIKKLKTKQLRG